MLEFDSFGKSLAPLRDLNPLQKTIQLGLVLLLAWTADLGSDDEEIEKREEVKSILSLCQTRRCEDLMEGCLGDSLRQEEEQQIVDGFRNHSGA